MAKETDKKKELAAETEASIVIQRRWRELIARREVEKEKARTMQSMSHIAAAAAESAAYYMSQEKELTKEEECENLIEEYRKLLQEREEIIEQNLACQRLLAKYFSEQRIRKGEEEHPQLTTPELEQRYWKMMKQLCEERKRASSKHNEAESQLENQRMRYQSIIEEAMAQEHNFREYMRETALRAVFMRSHQSISADTIQNFLDREESQRGKIRAARIRYLQLKNTADKLYRAVTNRDSKQKDGMFLIDFEQLKTENTNFNEKIEERNEDLAKLRRKVTTTIHVLTHVKEKLEFLKGENAQLRRQVTDTEDVLNGIRDQLAQTKKKRDNFTNANIKLREKMPMVGSEDLLLDYEKRKGVINDKRLHVVSLTRRHQELSDWIKMKQPVLDMLKSNIEAYPSV